MKKMVIIFSLLAVSLASAKTEKMNDKNRGPAGADGDTACLQEAREGIRAIVKMMGSLKEDFGFEMIRNGQAAGTGATIILTRGADSCKVIQANIRAVGIVE